MTTTRTLTCRGKPVSRLSRRDILAGTASLLPFTLAGCAGLTNQNNTPTDTTETPTGPTTTDTPHTGSTTQETTGTGTETTTEPPPEPADLDVTIDAPTTVSTGDYYDATIEIRNTGGEPGRFSTQLWIEQPGDNAEPFSYDVTTTVDPGETVRETREIWADGIGTATLQIDPYAVEQTVEYTAENAEPKMYFADLVKQWDTFGDAHQNAIGVDTVGDRITVAFRHGIAIHDGTYHATAQMVVRKAETGEQVAVESYESERIVDTNGYDTWETALQTSTRNWDPGEYRANVIIRDEVNGEVSNEVTVPFHLIEQETECTDVEIVSQEWGEQDPGNEPYDNTPDTYTATLRNNADVAGNVKIAIRFIRGGDIMTAKTTTRSIGAGEEKTVELEAVPPEEGARLYVMIGQQHCEAIDS